MISSRLVSGNYHVQLSDEAISRVKRSREVVDKIVEGDKGESQSILLLKKRQGMNFL